MSDRPTISLQKLRDEVPRLNRGFTTSHTLAISLILLTTFLLLAVHLGTGDSVDMMELYNLVPVREAFRDGHWLMPTLAGQPRLQKPPLPVWVPAALATLLKSDSLWIVRIPSVFMATLAALATYGLGCRLFRNPNDTPGSHRGYALLAALFLPSLIIFNRQARLASYDIFATAFITLAAYAFVVLAESDSTPTSSRLRWWLWTILAGISTGLSVMSKGPVPAATIMLPLGLWLLIYHRRWRVWASVATAALISLFTFMPWLIAIGGIPGLIPPHIPGAWETWIREFKQFGTGEGQGTKAELTDPPYYYLQMFLWIAPLTPTFIAGLFLPYLSARSASAPAAAELRGRRLIWMIVILGLLLLSFASEKKARYALQIFPFAALLCASVWQEFIRLPRNQKPDAAANAMLVAQALFLIVPGLTAIFAALWVWSTNSFFRWPDTATALRLVGLPFIILAGLAVAAVGALLWRQTARHQFTRAAITLACGAALLTLSFKWAYRGWPGSHTNPARDPVEQALTLTAASPIYTFSSSHLWLSTLYYTNRPLPFIDADSLASQANAHPQDEPFLLIVTDTWNTDLKKFLPQLGAQDQLQKTESLTGRKFEEVSSWLDEGRRTVLFRLKRKDPAGVP